MNKRFLCIMLAGTLVFASGLNVLATSVTEVQKEQTETKNKLNEVNKSIEAIEKKQKEVQSQLSNLNQELVDAMLTLELLEADLERKEEEITDAQAELERLQALEEEQYNAMKLRIQYMYEKGNTSYITMLLEAESVSDFLNKADFVQEVSDYDDEKLTEYQETKELVAETKKVLEEEKEELVEIQEAQQIYKADLDQQIAFAKTKVANFESELSNAKAKAKEYQNTIKQQTALIQQMEEEAKKSSQTSNETAISGTGNSGTNTNKGGSTSGGGTTTTTTTASGSGTGASIANYALKFVGNPYVSGGTSLTNGADCSGFTWAVHQHFGISIPRVSTAQANSGKPVSLSAIQAGDIIYYGGHVGIYIGNGKIVHASTEKTGIKVSSYTYRTPICARRYW